MIKEKNTEPRIAILQSQNQRWYGRWILPPSPPKWVGSCSKLMKLLIQMFPQGECVFLFRWIPGHVYDKKWRRPFALGDTQWGQPMLQLRTPMFYGWIGRSWIARWWRGCGGNAQGRNTCTEDITDESESSTKENLTKEDTCTGGQDFESRCPQQSPEEKGADKVPRASRGSMQTFAGRRPPADPDKISRLELKVWFQLWCSRVWNGIDLPRSLRAFVLAHWAHLMFKTLQQRAMTILQASDWFFHPRNWHDVFFVWWFSAHVVFPSWNLPELFLFGRALFMI